MSPEFALIDANVLVYSCYRDSEHHSASYALLERAQNEDAGLCVAAQCLTEFYCVVTNPRRVSLPREPNDVLQTIEAMLKLPGLTRRSRARSWRRADLP